MNPDPDFSLVPSECKSQKLEVLSGCYPRNPAFIPVHLQLQFPFQVACTAFQQPLRRPFAFAKKYDVIGIPDCRYSSPLELLVKLMEVDIRQEWGKWSALRAAFFRCNLYAIIEHSAFQKFLDQLDYSLVRDFLTK